jgi:hypothetical protein
MLAIYRTGALLFVLIAHAVSADDFKNRLSVNVNDYSIYAVAYDRDFSFARLRISSAYTFEDIYGFNKSHILSMTLGLRKDLLRHRNFNFYGIIEVKNNHSRITSFFRSMIYNTIPMPLDSMHDTVYTGRIVKNKTALCMGAGLEMVFKRVFLYSEITPYYWYEWYLPNNVEHIFLYENQGIIIASGSFGIGIAF